MARYSSGHKEATRRRLVETAARRFKSDGIGGSGVAVLVADAGLTNGAFYGHFASKSDLVASVVAQQMENQVAVVNSMPSGPGSAEAFLREYLSLSHRGDPGGGCPSAAMLDEIGRSDAAVRGAYTDGVGSMIEAIARHLDGSHSPGGDARAIALFSLLVGSLQMARAVTDPELSERILDAAYSQALTITGALQHLPKPAGQEPR